jgi:cytochrome b561
MIARLLAIAASGWLLVALLAVTIRLPYRRRGRRRRNQEPAALPRLAGLRWHYWLGYAIAALALVHGMASMTRGIAGRAHPAGLRLASLALLVALCEVAIGLTLRGRVQGRAALRRLHFWVMAALVVLVAVHVALDSWLLGTFRGT